MKEQPRPWLAPRDGSPHPVEEDDKGLQTAPTFSLLDLFDSSGAKVGKHYAGPTWESTVDGSKVSAKVKARATAPEPEAIPWLLLSATQTTGDGVMARVKSVQRTDTHGGAPPAGACSAGQAVKVPYTAVYLFSRPKP